MFIIPNCLRQFRRSEEPLFLFDLSTGRFLAALGVMRWLTALQRLVWNLYKGFRRHSAAARAALLIQKSKHFSKRIGICRIPKKGAFAPYIDQAYLLQFFQVVRKRGCWNLQFFLNFPRDHCRGMSGKQQAQNCQPGLGAQCGKTVRGSSDEQRIGPLHISIIAEIRKHVNCVPVTLVHHIFVNARRFTRIQTASGLNVGLPTGSGNAC